MKKATVSLKDLNGNWSVKNILDKNSIKIDFKNQPTEELGENYLDFKRIEKDIKKFQLQIKEILFHRIDLEGEQDKKHLTLINGDISVTKELREKVTVVVEPAIAFLEKNNLREYIAVDSKITKRKEVNPKDIPKQLLEDMQKFFDIEVTKSVEKSTLDYLVERGQLTEDNYEALTAV